MNKKFGAVRIAVAAAIMLSAFPLSGCYNGRPGYNSDRHHGHHDGDRHDRHRPDRR